MKDQLDKGKNPDEVCVDIKMTIIKEVGARWMVFLYDYFLNNPDICKNGFVKARSTEAITDPDSILSLKTEIKTDLIESCDND